MSVKRYDIDGYDAAMLDSSDGDYVLYDDVSEYIDLAHRWYNADGTFEVLDKDEVIRRRKDAAAQLATLAAENRAMAEAITDRALVLLADIVNNADRLTTANLAHHRSAIKHYAQTCANDLADAILHQHGGAKGGTTNG